jgi:hypothetical protein
MDDCHLTYIAKLKISIESQPYMKYEHDQIWAIHKCVPKWHFTHKIKMAYLTLMLSCGFHCSIYEWNLSISWFTEVWQEFHPAHHCCLNSRPQWAYTSEPSRLRVVIMTFYPSTPPILIWSTTFPFPCFMMHYHVIECTLKFFRLCSPSLRVVTLRLVVQGCRSEN